MADNPQPPKAQPPLPSSGTTGHLKSPTTKLPGQKTGTGKVVVMLSSVAKAAPAGTQQLPRVPMPFVSPPKIIPADSSTIVRQPPPLPPRQVAPAVRSTPAPLSTTTYVKLPPKTAEPALVSLTGKPLVPSEKKEANKVAAPLLPAKRSQPIKTTGPISLGQVPSLAPPQPAKSEMKKTGMIKLNPSTPETPVAADSIFLPADKSPEAKPAGWKNLEPGELNVPSGSIKDEVFARSQRIEGKPAPVAPVPEPKDKPMIAPPLVMPRIADPVPAAKAGPSLHPAPVALPSAKAPEEPPAHPLHVAPPMLEKGPEGLPEKLPQPHLSEQPKSAMPDIAPPPLHKAPAMIEPELPPAKPMMPLPVTKPLENKLKKSAPIVLNPPASNVVHPGIAETKPALRPAVLPKRAMPLPKEPEAVVPPPLPVIEAKAPAEKLETPSPIKPVVAPETRVEPPKVEPVIVPVVAKTEPEKPPVSEKRAEPAAKPSGKKPADPIDREAAIAASAAAGAAAVAALGEKKRPPLPPTRVERSKKRRIIGTVIFWIAVVPATVAVLIFGILHFGRDTRVEGQVIPPAGMSLSDEVWIVTDFRTLSSGIAEDLAAERTPLMQEIQERRDHVQRAQADVASREERIRLLQEEIQAARDEITTLVKQSRDATQKIWDGDGAEIDDEYQSHVNGLKKAIADRAASLKLKYAPDDTFQSPEVWANAYRLALYEVPPGVDGTKEHQWLSDQMKTWRDFQKSLDDRQEKLREEAAAKKLEPAPKIADLNAKIDDLTQRVSGTQAEEVPLKAELQQAQADLADADSSDTGLDDKYYKQLDSLPAENVTKHISLRANGRFTWVEDDSFSEGEQVHNYWIFSRATRADGRQYWALQPFSIPKNKTVEMTIEPGGFVSTKAILRPNLPPDEQEQ